MHVYLISHIYGSLHNAMMTEIHKKKALQPTKISKQYELVKSNRYEDEKKHERNLMAKIGCHYQ